ELVRIAGALPDRTDDVDHLPVGDPFAAGAFTLLALCASHRPLHPCGDTFGGSDRDIRLHPALPQRAAAVAIRRVDGAADAIFVGPHVAVGHRDRIDVRVDELAVPGHRVRHAVD